MLFVINFLFALGHVHLLTRGDMDTWGTRLNWIALSFNSLAVILALLS